MIRFNLNGNLKQYQGNEEVSLLTYLREVEGIVSPKDGCSAQGSCGACLIEMNGKPTLACRTTMAKVEGAEITTIEGFDPDLRDTLAKAFVSKGAVQCGFCTPGFLSRTKILLKENKNPSKEEIKKALSLNLCRCTGYVKVIDAIQLAAQKLQSGDSISLNINAKIGDGFSKLDAYQKAIGQSPFIADLKVENMLYGALKFSDHPRAKILAIDTSQASKIPGVIRIFTAEDIPGDRITGHLIDDWPLMIKTGETTRYIGDVLAGVVAISEEIAREAIELIKIEAEVLEPLTDRMVAEDSPILIHKGGNLLSETRFQRGQPIEQILENSAFTVSATYETQFVEHGFLETEAALAEPWNDGIRIYVQSQGIYEDRDLISRILNLPKEKVNTILIPPGGAFGGKEDLTVQGHAALFAYQLKKPVRVKLTRDESIRMHPKRHPFTMQYQLGCDDSGKLTGIKAVITGDTGAYASLGPAVLNRAAGHAASGYYLPNVDVVSKAVYTNNIPCGAMRGFGVNQVTFAMDCAMDELCEKGGFDRWQFRFNNALEDGLQTTTGQILKGGIGLKQCLLTVKESFQSASNAGLAVGIKNIGFGNGLVDESETRIDIESEDRIVLSHGWTEMGQGIDTIAVQILCQETGLDPKIIQVHHSTTSDVIGGTTTASRGTFLLGNSTLSVAAKLKEDLKTQSLKQLVGKSYRGTWSCDWTNTVGDSESVISHVAYSYAAQVVMLDEKGIVSRVIAAHDVGKAINPILVEGQIEGGVVMGLGYAFSEDLPLEKGELKNTKFGKLGIPRIRQLPEIDVHILEVEDPFGPYGAKGIGEIGLVPTAAASANALYQFDKIRRYKLPLK